MHFVILLIGMTVAVVLLVLSIAAIQTSRNIFDTWLRVDDAVILERVRVKCSGIRENSGRTRLKSHDFSYPKNATLTREPH